MMSKSKLFKSIGLMIDDLKNKGFMLTMSNSLHDIGVLHISHVTCQHLLI